MATEYLCQTCGDDTYYSGGLLICEGCDTDSESCTCPVPVWEWGE